MSLPRLNYKETIVSVLHALSCSLMKISHVNQPCELPCYPMETHKQETEGSRHVPETLSPIAQEELNPASNHVSNLEVDPFSVKFCKDHKVQSVS